MTRYLAAALLCTACSTQPIVEIPLPRALGLSKLPAASRERLRAVVTIPRHLQASELAIDLDEDMARGTFTLPDAHIDEAQIVIDFLSGLTADSEEVLLARTWGTVRIESGKTNKPAMSALVTDGQPIFDINRNGQSNLTDLAQEIDPAPGPLPVDVSPSTITFESGVPLGGFTRAFFVVENTIAEDITLDLDVRLVPGVSLAPLSALFAESNEADSTHQQALLAPGDEQVFAVTFAPTNSLFLVGGISVGTLAAHSQVQHQTMVRILGNPDGAVPRPPPGYETPVLPAGVQIGSYTGPVASFSALHLFARAPNSLEISELQSGKVGLVDVDFAYLVRVLAKHRFSVTLDGLSDDLDLYLFELDATFQPKGAPVDSSTNSGTSSESVEYAAPGDSEEDALLLVTLDRIDIESETPVAGGLSPAEVRSVMQAAMFSVPELCDTRTPGCPGPLATGPGDDCPESYARAHACGRAAGSTQLVVRGRNFQNGASVAISGQNAICAQVESETTDADVHDLIRCITPPARDDATQRPLATVVVTNPDGQVATLADGFAYVPPPPALLSVTPSTGPIAGQLTVQLFGRSLFSRDTRQPEVRFGPHLAELRHAKLDLDTQTLEVVLPECASCSGANAVDVTATNPDGQAAVLLRGFQYESPQGPAPSIAAVTPDRGSTAGGTIVAISGSGFSTGVSTPPTVRFGGIQANIEVASASLVSVRTPPLAPGRVDVELVNSDGQASRLRFGFTVFIPAPRIDQVIPAHGPPGGGTVVLLTGSGFQNGVVVRVGGVLAPQFVVAADGNSLTLSTPPQLPGAASVEVVNLDGQRALLDAAFTYNEPSASAPTVASVVPATGSVEGGDEVTLRGTSFQVGAQVVFGETSAPLVTVESAQKIVARTPPHGLGHVNVRVINPDAQKGELASGFEFRRLAPQVGAVVPALGPVAGGTVVLITGQRFQAGTQVHFGAEAAVQVLAQGQTITCKTPPGQAGAGAVAVKVTNPDGQLHVLAGAFTYAAAAQPAPKIFYLNPTSGPALGGTAVTIHGDELAAGVSVYFADNRAQVLEVRAPTLVTVLLPPGRAGETVSVTIQNLDGQSDVRPFVYTNARPSMQVSAVVPGSGASTLTHSVLVLGQSFSVGARLELVPRVGSAISVANPLVVTSSIITATLPHLPTAVSDAGVGVRVTNPDGSVHTLANGFTYLVTPAPVLPPFTATHLVPNRGPSALATTVLLLGSGFDGSESINVASGGWGARVFTVALVSSNILRVVLPPYGGAPGHGPLAAELTVAGAQGSVTLPDAFFYDAPLAPAPRILSLQPASGSILGGDLVAVRGEGFDIETLTVTLGALSVTPIEQTEELVRFELPALVGADAEEIVLLELRNGDGQSDAVAFTYELPVPPPEPPPFDVHGISPSEGGRGRLHEVLLYGTGLDTELSAHIADSFSWSSDVPIASLGDGRALLIVPAYGGVLRGDVVTTVTIMEQERVKTVTFRYTDPTDTWTCNNNGIREGIEQCDGDGDFHAFHCTDLGYQGGRLLCRPDCTLDDSQCRAPANCGDGFLNVEAREHCDGENLNGQTCRLLGLGGGRLACRKSCAFDFSGCQTYCGNGVVDGGVDGGDQGQISEQCDGDAFVPYVTGHCSLLEAAGGDIPCNPVSCAPDLTACVGGGSQCGNGILEKGDGEQCDGVNLAGRSCVTLGFADGVLACTSQCKLNVAACNPALTTCTNGLQDGGESSVDCGETCPPCGDSAPCSTDSDCLSNNCPEGLCQPGDCSNGKRDGAETDVDCGGACLTSCASTARCIVLEDCAFVFNGALNQCLDGVCGLSAGAMCIEPTDCVTGFCENLVPDPLQNQDIGVCCESACSDPCTTCRGDSTPACETVPGGTADVRCATGLCADGGVCQVLSPGSPCNVDQMCDTGFCADGVCCDTQCAGACVTCGGDALSGTTQAGVCGPVLSRTMDPLCPQQFCGEFGVCMPQSCIVDADCSQFELCDQVFGTCVSR